MKNLFDVLFIRLAMNSLFFFWNPQAIITVTQEYDKFWKFDNSPIAKEQWKMRKNWLTIFYGNFEHTYFSITTFGKYFLESVVCWKKKRKKILCHERMEEKRPAGCDLLGVAENLRLRIPEYRLIKLWHFFRFFLLLFIIILSINRISPFIPVWWDMFRKFSLRLWTRDWSSAWINLFLSVYFFDCSERRSFYLPKINPRPASAVSLSPTDSVYFPATGPACCLYRFCLERSSAQARPKASTATKRLDETAVRLPGNNQLSSFTDISSGPWWQKSRRPASRCATLVQFIHTLICIRCVKKKTTKVSPRSKLEGETKKMLNYIVAWHAIKMNKI